MLDGRVGRKDQFARLISAFGPAFNSTVDTKLINYAFTPRLLWDGKMFSRRANAVFGLDYIFSDYDSDRSRNPSDAPIHIYTGEQHSVAAYGQVNVGLSDRIKVTIGGRLQNVMAEAADRFNAGAPGASGFDAQQTPIDESDFQWAANIGLQYRITPQTSAFARFGRSFRIPTMDERIKPFTGQSLTLNTQRSVDYEVGARWSNKKVSLQATAFWMDLTNEIHFNPATFANINYQPTRRRGIETSATWRPNKEWSVNGHLTFTEAEFREGAFTGNDVPLVSPITSAITVDWQFMQTVGAQVGLTYASAKRMDNDENNFQPKLASYTLVDIGLRGRYKSLNWAARVNNLLDKEYSSYTVASATTFGTYNAYPLPGRTLWFELSLDF